MNDDMKIVCSIPVLSELVGGADYSDLKSFTGNCSMKEFLVRMMTYQPAWLRMLYKVRGIVAKIMGLEHDVVSNANKKVDDFDFDAGGKVDFFTTVVFKAEHYWVGEATDKHLSGYIGVFAESSESGEVRFHIFTVVNYRNWTGPVYFNLIRPFHHIVVHNMGKYAAKG